MVYDEHSSFGALEKCWQKIGCQRFTADVMHFRLFHLVLSKSFIIITF